MPLKQREIEVLLKGEVHPKVVRVLCDVLDQVQQLERNCMAMAQCLDQCINLLNQFNQVAEKLESATAKMNKISEGDKYDDTIN